MCATILSELLASRPEWKVGTYVVKSVNRLVYIAGGVFVQFLVVAKDNDSDIDRAED